MKRNFKKLTKLIVIASAISGASVLTSCTNDNRGNWIASSAQMAKMERATEQKIVDTMNSYEVGALTFDMISLDAVKKDGKGFFVLNGDFIYDQTIGREKGTVTFAITDANYDIAKEIYNKPAYDSGNYSALSNDYLAWEKYSKADFKKFIDIMNEESTKLYSVMNLETRELLYSSPEHRSSQNAFEF